MIRVDLEFLGPNADGSVAIRTGDVGSAGLGRRFLYPHGPD
jgi:hypothetical protein